MTEVLDKALARKEELHRQLISKKNQFLDVQSQISKIEQSIAELDDWIGKFYEIAGIPIPRYPEQNRSKSIAEQSLEKNPSREEIAGIAVAMIKAAQRPLSRKAIFDGLVKRNIHIKGKNPLMVLSTMLWRSKDVIVRVPNYGYWPADTNFDASHYDPTIDDLLGVIPNGTEANDDGDQP